MFAKVAEVWRSWLVVADALFTILSGAVHSGIPQLSSTSRPYRVPLLREPRSVFVDVMAYGADCARLLEGWSIDLVRKQNEALKLGNDTL